MSRTFNTDPLPIKAARLGVPVRAEEQEEGYGCHQNRTMRNSSEVRGSQAQKLWEDIHQGKDVNHFALDSYLDNPELRHELLPEKDRAMEEEDKRSDRNRRRMEGRELVKEANSSGFEID